MGEARGARLSVDESGSARNWEVSAVLTAQTCPEAREPGLGGLAGQRDPRDSKGRSWGEGATLQLCSKTKRVEF